MFVSFSSTPLGLSRHTRHMHRSIMSRESRLVESEDKRVKCSRPLTCSAGLAEEPCCLGEHWRSDPDCAVGWCLQSSLNSRMSRCKAMLHQSIHSRVNFCNISVYLSYDSIISTFFFCLSFPEVIILQNRYISLSKPAMLTYFIYKSYREDRWKIESFRGHGVAAVFCSGTERPMLVLCCSPIKTPFWTRNSRAHLGFLFLY